MSKKRKALIVAGAVVAILGLGGLAVGSKKAKGAEVRTEAVARRDLVSVVTASGVIQPKKKVDISADISGRVIQLAVEEGQWVNKGDLLLRIDPTTYEANVRRAEAAVAQAQAQEALARANALKGESDLKRAEQLSQGENLISREQLEQARTAASVARAQLEAARFGVAQNQAALSEAREALRKTTIVAPMSGRVTRRNIEEGETAIVGTMNNPGSLLLTIADLAEMEARIKVDETDVPGISVGDSAGVRIDAYPGKIFSGKVTRIAQSSLQSTGASMASAASGQQAVDFEVIIALDTPPEGLRPDLSATADVVTETRKNVLSVPIISVAVRDADGKKFKAEEESSPSNTKTESQKARSRAAEVEGVFLMVDGKAEWKPVKVGIAGDRYFEVISGLTGGEQVVSGAYQAIRELEAGAPIRVEMPKEKKSTTAAKGGK
jgi:HlyD family secretion protein